MKYKIAICGTFDVENYGDLLFPSLLKQALRKRGLVFESFLFSPIGVEEKPLSSIQEHVYSCDAFEEIDSKEHFDAVIIGGGAILHYEKISVKIPGSDSFNDYYTIKTWLPIILYSKSKGIKVLLNAPQAPFGFKRVCFPFTADIFSACDYLSVRDEDSANKLADLFDSNNTIHPKINTVPDSICAIGHYYNKKELTKKAKALLRLDEGDRYVVFHISRFLPAEAEPTLLKALAFVAEHNLIPVFLPLGPCHGDYSFMQNFKEKHNLKNVIIPDAGITIDDMTAILAACELYCGTSFHGSVVSLMFGNKATGFNYYTPTQKSVELYKQLGISEYLTTNYRSLLKNLKKLLKEPGDFKPKLSTISKTAERHFDTIADIISSNKKAVASPNFYKSGSELLAEIPIISSQLDAVKDELKSTNIELEKELLKYKEIAGIFPQKSHEEIVSFCRKYEEIERSRLWNKILYPTYRGALKIKKLFNRLLHR